MLRIVAGKYRGIKLDEVLNQSTRPTTDKNKEMLFNILGQFFDGGIGLDLFSGSGALGIEALSRGFEQMTFVENNPQAIQVINRNISKLRDLPKQASVVFRSDVLDYLNSSIDHKFDLILADPPYQLDIYSSIIKLVSSNGILVPEGILVLEAEKSKELLELPKDYSLIREKIAGNTKFFIIRREK